MTARTSRAVATKRANQAVRSRMKALRLNEQVEPPEVLAGELVKLLKQASLDNPGEWSQAYAEHVINQFSSQYLRLCEVAPIPVGGKR